MILPMPYNFCRIMLREILNFGETWTLLSAFTARPLVNPPNAPVSSEPIQAFDIIPEITCIIKRIFLQLTITDTFCCSSVSQYANKIKSKKVSTLRDMVDSVNLKSCPISGQSRNGSDLKIMKGTGKRGRVIKADYVKVLTDHFIAKRGNV
jgi:hypothetical protein